MMDVQSPRGPYQPRRFATPWLRMVPLLFILIWSSGYVVARLGLPYAPPLTFLSARYVGVVVFMGLLALVGRARWPSSSRQAGHLCVAGLLMQAGYLGGVWCAIELGMPAGMAALIVNTQPILTAVLDGFLGQSVRPLQWLGLFLGFLGVALVISTKMTTTSIPTTAVALCLFALLSMTIGTLYQKRFCSSADVRSAQVIQFLAALVVTLPLALWLEHPTIEPTANLLIAYAWSVFVLSGGGITLLFLMIRHGQATEVTSYFYMVPPVTALMAFIMFRETFNSISLLGLAITSLAVALVVTRQKGPAQA